MLTTNTAKFTLNTARTSDGTLVNHLISPDFSTPEATIAAIVDRIAVKTRYLSCIGFTVKGVNVADAKAIAREIRGMISALECVCESNSLQNALLDNLASALTEALARLRK